MILNNGPASSGATITPSDSTVIPATRGIYVGGPGDLVVLLADDSATITLKSVTAGAILPLCATKVMATNTTATFLVALR